MKQIQSLFQGLAIVTVEYTQILLTFFKDQTGWQFTTEMALFSTLSSQEGQQKKSKSNPVRHSRQRVRSIKQEDLS
jgi:hypothetical protein